VIRPTYRIRPALLGTLELPNLSTYIYPGPQKSDLFYFVVVWKNSGTTINYLKNIFLQNFLQSRKLLQATKNVPRVTCGPRPQGHR